MDARLGRRLRREDEGDDAARAKSTAAISRAPASTAARDAPVVDPTARRHLEVHSGGDADDAVVDGAPVVDDEAAEAPLLAEDRGEEVVVIGAVDAIQPIVGAHHRPRLRLDGALKGGEVDLAERGLVDARVRDHPEELLVVRREVLERRAHAQRLHAADEGGRQHARQQRVFGKVLKVAAAQRVALDVDAGAEHHRHLLRRALAAQRLARLPAQLRVPRLRERACRREARRRYRFAHAEVVGRVGLLAQPVRPVGQHDAREPKARQRLEPPELGAGAQPALLGERHLRDEPASLGVVVRGVESAGSIGHRRKQKLASQGLRAPTSGGSYSRRGGS